MSFAILFLKLLVIVVISWALGSFAQTVYHFATDRDGYGGYLEYGIELAFFSFFVVVPLLSLVYLPMLFAIRRALKGTRPKILFVVAATLLWIPISFVIGVSRTSDADVLLYVAGFILGLGFVNLMSMFDKSEGTMWSGDNFDLRG
jgi:hypothetical protein